MEKSGVEWGRVEGWIYSLSELSLSATSLFFSRQNHTQLSAP